MFTLVDFVSKYELRLFTMVTARRFYIFIQYFKRVKEMTEIFQESDGSIPGFSIKPLLVEPSRVPVI